MTADCFIKNSYNHEVFCGCVGDLYRAILWFDTIVSDCANKKPKTQCDNWVKLRFCTHKYATWMKTNCAQSCGYCLCKDNSNNCAYWGGNGECTKNPNYMLLHCQKSCAVCRPKLVIKTSAAPMYAGSGAGSIAGSGSQPTTQAVVKKPTASDDDNIKCGTRATLGRIVGGKKAPTKGWPWQVGIKSCPTCRYFCGGTIVAKRWVITAAHCLVNYRASDLHIDAGVTNQKNTTEHKQSFNCTAIHAHQKYAIKAPYDDDIAILQLNKDVFYNDHIRPLCLNENELKTGERCSVTGYGRVAEGAASSVHLLQADVPIVAHNVCVQACMRRIPPRPVTKNMICAGYDKGGIDACAGDSGGPLTCWDRSKQRYVLGGIVSWGIGCGRPNTYGVYTEMEHLSAWITNITGKIV
ncbi:serine protease 44-like [Dendronephthya gigantea]|uniref:serine protease 44-like n=1 Tax=Dendronephthya gigantea TaxID=151771 RepID=UPI00106B16C2|nr:serine protease 44-like [Dendronephthya gigantea]